MCVYMAMHSHNPVRLLTPTRIFTTSALLMHYVRTSLVITSLQFKRKIRYQHAVATNLTRRNQPRKLYPRNIICFTVSPSLDILLTLAYMYLTSEVWVEIAIKSTGTNCLGETHSSTPKCIMHFNPYFNDLVLCKAKVGIKIHTFSCSVVFHLSSLYLLQCVKILIDFFALFCVMFGQAKLIHSLL